LICPKIIEFSFDEGFEIFDLRCMYIWILSLMPALSSSAGTLELTSSCLWRNKEEFVWGDADKVACESLIARSGVFTSDLVVPLTIPL
jgi:hypothetical protein